VIGRLCEVIGRRRRRLFMIPRPGRKHAIEADKPAIDTVLSFPKSGRTWLAYLHAYYAAYRLPPDHADRFIDEEMPHAGHVYRPQEKRPGTARSGRSTPMAAV